MLVVRLFQTRSGTAIQGPHRYAKSGRRRGLPKRHRDVHRQWVGTGRRLRVAIWLPSMDERERGVMGIEKTAISRTQFHRSRNNRRLRRIARDPDFEIILGGDRIQAGAYTDVL